jgi:hypothetical protein
MCDLNRHLVRYQLEMLPHRLLALRLQIHPQCFGAAAAAAAVISA